MGYYVEVESRIHIYVQDINSEAENTLLFVHGWPLNHHLFEYQFNVLPKLGFRCIGMDLRGFGQSDKPWHGYDYNQLADDLSHLIRSLQLHSITLVGHSMAGAIAIRYLARYGGDHVSKLVLVDAAAQGFRAFQDFYLVHDVSYRYVVIANLLLPLLNLYISDRYSP